MLYATHIAERKENFAETVSLAKEPLIAMALDTSLPGTSSIRTLLAETKFCAADSISPACDTVNRLRLSLLEKRKALNELRKSHADLQLIQQCSESISELTEDLLKKQDEVCADCRYQAHLTKRYNYRRIGRIDGRKETLSNIKTYLALSLLVPSSAPEKGSPIRCFRLRTDLIANLTNLSTVSIRNSLKFWETAGYIVYSYTEHGTVTVCWTRSAVQKKYAPREEGGHGYMTVPFEMFSSLMNIMNLDVLRMAVAALVQVDNNLYDGAYTMSGSAVISDGALLRFVRKHKNASMTDLLDRFNRGMKKTGYIFHLMPTFDSDMRPDFSKIKITLSNDLLPKQNAAAAAISKNQKIISRGLTPASIRAIEEAQRTIISSPEDNASGAPRLLYNTRLNFLFPRQDGSSWTGGDSNLRPKEKADTLIPVLESIAGHFGSVVLKRTIVKSFEALSGKLKLEELFEKVKPTDAAYRPIIEELSAYMYALAAELRDSVFSDRHILIES